jgi:hypothetical protein
MNIKTFDSDANDALRVIAATSPPYVLCGQSEQHRAG